MTKEIEFTEHLEQPWIIWVDEAGEYACAVCAEEHAEDAGWHQQHEDLWTEDEDGERTGNEAHAISYMDGETDTPVGCIGCGAWLDVNLTDEAWDYMEEREFPQWLIDLYRANN